MVFGADNALSRDIVDSAFFLIAALVNGYVFGSIWDDRNKGKEALASQAVNQGDQTTTNVQVSQ